MDATEAVAGADAGADFLGLNFSRKSVRCVTADQAETIRAALPDFRGWTGVFVEQSETEMIGIAERWKLGWIQFYPSLLTDSEHPTVDTVGSLQRIAALRVRTADDLLAACDTIAKSRPEYLLIDSFVPGAMGGTGHVAPWHLLAGIDFGIPLILAGGLTPDNVGEAIRTVRPWGVDVASGIESAPGRKDVGKMRAFVQAVRDAERAL